MPGACRSRALTRSSPHRWRLDFHFSLISLNMFVSVFIALPATILVVSRSDLHPFLNSNRSSCPCPLLLASCLVLYKHGRIGSLALTSKVVSSSHFLQGRKVDFREGKKLAWGHAGKTFGSRDSNLNLSDLNESSHCDPAQRPQNSLGKKIQYKSQQ